MQCLEPTSVHRSPGLKIFIELMEFLFETCLFFDILNSYFILYKYSCLYIHPFHYILYTECIIYKLLYSISFKYVSNIPILLKLVIQHNDNFRVECMVITGMPVSATFVTYYFFWTFTYQLFNLLECVWHFHSIYIYFVLFSSFNLLARLHDWSKFWRSISNKL